MPSLEPLTETTMFVYDATATEENAWGFVVYMTPDEEYPNRAEMFSMSPNSEMADKDPQLLADFNAIKQRLQAYARARVVEREGGG